MWFIEMANSTNLMPRTSILPVDITGLSINIWFVDFLVTKFVQNLFLCVTFGALTLLGLILIIRTIVVIKLFY